MKNNKFKNWKLAKPCSNCQKERYEHGREYCFEHEWENPVKLKKDEQELLMAAFVLIPCFLYLLLALIYAWVFETMNLSLFASLFLASWIFVAFFLFLFKTFSEQWKKLKSCQNQWIKINPKRRHN